jgi:hypothetical protein
MSGEHYVSKSVLELVLGRFGEVNKSVLVSGLSFQQQGALQQLGISSLVGNILCATHNSLLSPLDVAGKAMFWAMDGMNDAAAEPALPGRVMCVDGDALERWVLKSMVGGLYSGAFRVSPTETMKGVSPPVSWLQVLFNGAEFPRGQGLYYLPRKRDEVIVADQYVLRFEPLGSRDGGVIGGIRLWFFGFEFALLMGTLAPGIPTMFDGALYRPAGLRTVGSGTRVRIDWKGGAGSEEAVFRLANATSEPPAARDR